MEAVLLWKRPRPTGAPAGFEARERQLLAQLQGIGRQHPSAALASSLSVEDVVLTHAIARSTAPIEVFVIDTGRLHAETLALLALVQQATGIQSQVVRPDPATVAAHEREHGRFGFYDSVALRHACCHLRKVEPLERALAGRSAWLTGQRRAHGPDRASLAEAETDWARNMAKFNPLALWSDEDVWHYGERHALPVNPLYERGYPSIGCEPCTRAIRQDEDARAGRWWWESSEKKECGLHVAREAA